MSTVCGLLVLSSFPLSGEGSAPILEAVLCGGIISPVEVGLFPRDSKGILRIRIE